MKNLTLSVIVPFFNEKKYLKSSVERLISVSIFKEIILVDDNSTDNSYSIAENLAHNVDNIQVLKNKMRVSLGELAGGKRVRLQLVEESPDQLDPPPLP